MKKKLLLAFLLFACAFSYGQQSVKKTFVYPFEQGDSKWVQINSVTERISALQIPDNIIGNIPTDELVEICLDFPYITDVLFYDDYQKGFEALMSEFNGFRELMSRKDIYDALLQKSKKLSLDIGKIAETSEIEKGKFSFRNFVLELLLAQDKLLMNIDSTQEKELLSVAIENMEVKSGHDDIFSTINTIPTYLLYAKMAVKDSKFKFADIEQEKKVTEFVKTPVCLDDSVINSVEKYIKSR